MPQKSKSPVPIEQIDALIRTVRGARVILDRDLAKVYGVPTFRFNEAIKRNRHRFPADFMFQLTRSEFDSLTSQIAMSKLTHELQPISTFRFAHLCRSRPRGSIHSLLPSQLYLLCR